MALIPAVKTETPTLRQAPGHGARRKTVYTAFPKGTRALAGVIERLKISVEIDRIIRGNGNMGDDRFAS
jgi:hypothetical protein